MCAFSDGISKRIDLQYSSQKINTRFVLALCFSLTFGLLILFIFKAIAPFKFAMNDDYSMNLMLSGAFGLDSGYSVFQNIILSKTISFLYNLFGSVNWYGLFMLGIIYLSFSVYGALLIDRFGFKIGIPLYVLVIAFFEIVLLYKLQFTICAFAGVLAGLCLLVQASDSEKGKQHLLFVLSGLFFIISFMTRWNVIIPAAVLGGGYCIILLIMRKKEALKTIIFAGIVGIICVAVSLVHTAAYNSDPVWKSYMRYNQVRSDLVDFSCPDYENHKDMHDSIGWSYNDLLLFVCFVTPDEGKFSTENLEKIAEYKKTNDYNLDIDSLFESFTDNIKSSTRMQNVIALILVCFVVCICFNRNKILPLCLLLSAPLFNFAFLIARRGIDRVVYPLYIIAGLMLLFIIDVDAIKEKLGVNQDKMSTRTKVKITAILLSIGLIIGTVAANFELQRSKSSDVPSIEMFDTYVSQNPQNVYVIAPNGTYPRNAHYTIFRVPPKNSLANTFPIGGWEQRTKYYEEFKRNNKIENIFEDLLTKDNYYIAPLAYKDLFITYFYENYGVSVDMQVVYEAGDIEICKVVPVY